MAWKFATVCTAGTKNTWADRDCSGIRLQFSFKYEPASSQKAIKGGQGRSFSGSFWSQEIAVRRSAITMRPKLRAVVSLPMVGRAQ